MPEQPKQPGYTLPADWIREVERGLKWIKNFRVTGARLFRNSPDGCSIDVTPVKVPPVNVYPQTITVIRVVGFTSPSSIGIGKYWAIVQQRTSTQFVANSTDLSMSTFYSDLNSTNVLLIAPDETTASGHTLASSIYVAAFQVDSTADGTAVYQLLRGFSFAC